MDNDYVLAPGWKLVSRMRVPHRVAYLESSHLVVHDLASDARKTIYEDTGGMTACALSWSPDGRFVFHSHARRLLALGVQRRLTRTVLESRGKIVWHLDCSPSGDELIFFEHLGRQRRIRLLDTKTKKVRTISALEGIWHFACDWSRREVVVGTLQPAIWRVDLDSGRSDGLIASERAETLDLAADGSVRFDVAARAPDDTLSGSIWRSDPPKEIIQDARHPSSSPDGNTIAFTRRDDQLHLYDVRTGRSECIVRSRETQTYRRGSYACAPRWSRDGRFLFFRMTLARRNDQPRHPDFAADMRRLEARATKRSPRHRRMDYAGSIEHDHWEFQFASGILDIERRRMCLRPSYWSELAWAP